jgi:methionyl-tRNA synthetase
MRRKRIPASDLVVPSEILEQAKKAVQSDRHKRRGGKCVVCGEECSPTSSEQLCWVCRRLKISAWHESEQQMPAQE